MLASTFRTPDWDQYQMDMRNPFVELEPLENEIRIVDEALTALAEAEIIPHTDYDHTKFLAHRKAVPKCFTESKWTAITPRMQRLLYAINGISRPANMVAAGIFWGNTFISNAGAAVGPGASYKARKLVGVEIDPEEAARAERNVRRIDATKVARIVAADAVGYVRRFPGQINLLYLDADGAGGRGKAVYLDILEACYKKMPAGSIVLAHNSVNAAASLADYFDFVRNPSRFKSSINVVFDPEGLEVSVK